MLFSKELEQAIDSRNVAKVKRLMNLIGQTVDCGELLSPKHYLMLAIETEKVEIVQSLIEAGADVNQTDEDGWTPIMYATLEGYFDIVKILIEAGADVNSESSSGEYALYIANYSNHQEIVKYLAPITDPTLRECL
jgi:ankyrin repeat protein